MRLLKECLPSRVVFISSVAVYGYEVKKNVPFNENGSLSGFSQYAQEKDFVAVLAATFC